MSEYIIPVSWEVSSTVKVIGAPSLEDAVRYVEEHMDEIPCSPDAEYIDGSYKVDDIAKESHEEEFPVYRHYGVDVQWRDDRFGQLKQELFMRGESAIEDFIGFPLSEFDEKMDKDELDNLMDQIAEQMPDGVLEIYYGRYLKEVTV